MQRVAISLEGDKMTVNELITELSGMPLEAEISYQVCRGSIELLIGEDEKTGEMITIKKPDW